MADEDTVVIQAADGQTFKVMVKVAKMSATLGNLIEDSGVGDVVPVPTVSGKTLGKIIEYCRYHTENPSVQGVVSKKEDGTSCDIIGWDVDFMMIDQDTLFDLVLATNYLDIPPLLDLCAKIIANLIKGKSTEELRKTFNIKNDFTAEEEEQIRKENEWASER